MRERRLTWGLFRFLLARLCMNRYCTNLWCNQKSEEGIRRLVFHFFRLFFGGYLIPFGFFCFLYPSSTFILFYHYALFPFRTFESPTADLKAGSDT